MMVVSASFAYTNVSKNGFITYNGKYYTPETNANGDILFSSVSQDYVNSFCSAAANKSYSLNFIPIACSNKSPYIFSKYYSFSTSPGVGYAYYMASAVEVTTPCTSPKIPDSSGQCVDPTPTCTADEDLVAGVCVPKCPTGQTVGTDGRCAGVCSTGSHWDYNATVPTCAGDIAYGEKFLHESGAYHVLFADGSLMFCRTDGKCSTIDLSGNIIDNRWYEGSIPSAPNVYTDLFNDALTLTGNLVGKTLQIAGYTIGLTSSGGGLLLSEDNPVTGAINPGVLAGAGLVSLGNLLITNNEKIITTPTDSGNAVKIYFNDSSTNNVAIFDSAPSDGAVVTVPNSNGVQAQKLYSEATLKEYQSHWAGQGELGATVLTAADQVALSILETQNQIKAIQKTSDTTATVTEINKSDIANTVANGTDLPYTQKQVTQTINNNGTVTTKTDTTIGTVKPTNNTNTNTNGTTGQTTSTPSSALSGTANTSDGKSIDLSGVTGRLDSVGKQLEKGNGLAEKGNELLGQLKENTSYGNGYLLGIQKNTASTANSLNEIKDLLSNGDVATTPHNLPTDTSAVNWNTYSSAWDNIKSSFSNVNDKVTEVTGLFQNGFQLDLTRGAVTSCAYQTTIDFGYFQIPFEYDLCASASPYRTIFYTFFYLLFSVGILSFSINAFLRLV